MLKERAKDGGVWPLPPIPEHRLWQDERRNTPSLGCWNCPERGLCGGLAIDAGLLNCLDLCCGKPTRCDKPCRNNPDYALRVREVGTFSLDNVPRADVLATQPLPLVATMLFHGKCRGELLGPEPVALSLYEMFNRSDGKLRFESYDALCAAFGLVPGTPIILTGIDRDSPLERWWGYEEKRREIIRGLKALGVVLATTPNFSLFVNVPRYVDLHAIKRIGLVHSEFLVEGLPAALHVNGRSETDFRRWGTYVRERPEVTHLAYEFTTGTSRAARRDLHVNWLTAIAIGADRPLDLILRGGIEVLPLLTSVFNRVTVIETSTFMKTINRQLAVPRVNGSPTWRSLPTAIGAPVDELFALNRAAVRRWIETQAAGQLVAKAVAAE